MYSQIIQEEECFVEADKDSLKGSRCSRQSVSVDFAPVKHYIPQPNQLHTHSRPTQPNSRVFSMEGFIQKLPQVLNEPCIEVPDTTKNKNIRIRLGSKQKVKLQKFLSNKDLTIIYDKNTNKTVGNLARQDVYSQKKTVISAETIRLRKLHSTTDFNEKYYKELPAYTQKTLQNQSFDQIDSDFECGNLSKVYTSKQLQNNHYMLLDQDINTHGYTNWFFFRVKAANDGRRRFFILNMGKKSQFYKQNMKISVFSMKRWKNQGTKWFKGGNNISFFQTQFEKNSDSDCYYYCLHFEYDMTQSEQVYFALCQPYSYSRLSNLIRQQKNENSVYEQKGISVKMNIIGYSLCSNIIPSVVITQNVNRCAKKKIVILGRQHPCEMAGSFISQALIRKLLDCDCSSTKFLLSNFQFHFIPMVNPDGVIYGNARCNIAGFDLNRQWGQFMIKQFTPETFKIRNYIENLQKNQESLGKVKIAFVLDLHGHGKKFNSFLFCCRNDDRYSHRIFPLIMSKLEKRFDLLSCTYGITRDKECSLRGQFFDLGIRNCFTLENSYYGYYAQNKEPNDQKTKQKGNSQKQIEAYTENDYKQLANGILKSLHIYLASSQNCDKNKIRQQYGFNYETIYEELIKIIDRLQRQQKNSYNEKDALSDSDPQGDILKLDERLKIYGNEKNKKLDEKIKEVFLRRKKMDKTKKSKIKIQLEKEDSLSDKNSQQKQSQRKLQEKLLVTQNFPKKNPKTAIKSKFSSHRKSTLIIQKHEVQLDESVDRRNLNSSFHVNLSQFPKKKPQRRLSSSAFNKSSGNKFDRARIYSKVKTEISESHNYSTNQIKEQSDRKEEVRKSFGKLKDQSLKTMIKESLFYLGNSYRNKKCIWVEGYKNKSEKNKKQRKQSGIYNSISESQSHLLRKSQIMEMQVNGNGRQRFFLDKEITKNDIRGNKNEEYRPAKSRFSQKNYHRFKSFMKNKSLKKHDAEVKSSVFYPFPVM